MWSKPGRWVFGGSERGATGATVDLVWPRGLGLWAESLRLRECNITSLELFKDQSWSLKDDLTYSPPVALHRIRCKENGWN